MSNVKISIITVVFNSIDKIEATILSVINQTYSNIEYIIIDGGSTDGTIEIIKKYSNKISFWISKPDKGVYDAMNKGIDTATGEWINFMNAGDSFYNNNVIHDIFHSGMDKSTTVIYGDTLNIFSFGNFLFKAKLLSEIERGMPFCHQSTFVKREVLANYHFDRSFKISADYNLFYNLYKKEYTFSYFPICISNYEVAEEGISNSSKLIKEEFLINKNQKLYYKRFFKYKIGYIIYALLPNNIVNKIKRKRMARISKMNT